MKQEHTPFAWANWTLWTLAMLPNALAVAAPTYALRSARKPGDIDRVVCKLEVGGETISATDDGKERRHKLSVVGDFGYDEKSLQIPTASADRTRSVRHYDKVDVVIKRDSEGRKPVLRPDRHLIGTDYIAGKLTLFSPKGRLTRNELILIDVLANSMLLDRFLPEKSVGVGDSWKHSAKLATAMFGLQSTSMIDLESTLIEVTDTTARFETSGHIEGIYESTPTKIDVKAKYRFNRKTRRIDWFGLLVKEDRPMGPIADGVDVVARFQMQIVPRGTSSHLTPAKLKGLSLSATPALALLTYRSEVGGWEFINDRRWHVVADSFDVAHLKLMDKGRVLAQCNVSPLPSQDPGKMIALLEFQNDVQKALGENCKEVVQAKQYANAADYRVYRVICRGAVNKVPIQWNYYYLADRRGRQVVFAFTIEQSLVGRLDKAHSQLIHTLRFVQRRVAKEEKKKEEEEKKEEK